VIDYLARVLATVGKRLLAPQDAKPAGFEQNFRFFHYKPTFSKDLIGRQGTDKINVVAPWSKPLPVGRRPL
jgi:hypothetical protein